MRANFLKRHFDIPSRNKPGDNISWLCVKISAEESLGFELACRIANDNPADWHWCYAGVIPECSPGGDFDDPIGLAIPATDA